MECSELGRDALFWLRTKCGFRKGAFWAFSPTLGSQRRSCMDEPVVEASQGTKIILWGLQISPSLPCKRALSLRAFSGRFGSFRHQNFANNVKLHYKNWIWTLFWLGAMECSLVDRTALFRLRKNWAFEKGAFRAFPPTLAAAANHAWLGQLGRPAKGLKIDLWDSN